MSFKSASFVSFRNLADAELDLDGERIFLVGENGQGKTNFLEALYYLCYGASFRGPTDALVPRKGEKSFGLKARWNDSLDGDLPDEEISLRFEGGAKDIRLNGKPLRDRKDLVHHNPAVVFCHEDFSFAAGDPERRRFFFDQCGSLFFLSYIENLRFYKKALKQRNAALKEGAWEVLDALDPQFARYGLALMDSRMKIRDLFKVHFSTLFEYVSRLGSNVELAYAPSWPLDMDVSAVLGLLAEKRESEMAFGTSRSGPHRDRWGFSAGKVSFTDTASTGQLRLVSLVLRIVQARIYAETVKGRESAPRWPVLLLDDVLLELDVGRRRRFLELLPGKGEGAQAIFTFLPEEPWTEYASGDTIVYKVKNGGFENQERF
jgi:DNA replication and repair protein RecF